MPTSPTRAEKKIVQLKRDNARLAEAFLQSEEEVRLLRSERDALAVSRGAIAVALRFRVSPERLSEAERKVVVDAHLDPRVVAWLNKQPEAATLPSFPVVVRVTSIDVDGIPLLVEGETTPFAAQRITRIVEDTPERAPFEADDAQRSRFLQALWAGWLAGTTLPLDAMEIP